MKSENETPKSIDLKLSIALIASSVVLTFQYLVLVLFDLIDTSLGAMVQIVSKIVVAVFFIYAFPAMWRRCGKTFVIAYGIAIPIFLLQYLLYMPNRPVLLGLVFPIFFISLPALIYTLALRDWKKFYLVSKKAAYLIFLFGIIITIFVFSGYSTIGTYSMALSYYMLFPSLIFMNDFIDKYRISSLFFSLVSIITILSLGSRGAVLCVGIFVLLQLIRLDFTAIRRAIIFRLIVLFSITLAAIKFQNILQWLNIKFKQYGISSRTIELFQKGEVDLSGRDNIAGTVFIGLKNNPITGIGIAGDRVLADTYSHNFFLEITSSFGIIIGLLIVGLLLVLIVRALIISDKFTYDLVILWLSLGFVSLMVSGSYLIEIKFWILIGLLISLNFQLNSRKNVGYE